MPRKLKDKLNLDRNIVFFSLSDNWWFSLATTVRDNATIHQYPVLFHFQPHGRLKFSSQHKWGMSCFRQWNQVEAIYETARANLSSLLFSCCHDAGILCRCGNAINVKHLGTLDHHREEGWFVVHFIWKRFKHVPITYCNMGVICYGCKAFLTWLLTTISAFIILFLNLFCMLPLWLILWSSKTLSDFLYLSFFSHALPYLSW